MGEIQLIRLIFSVLPPLSVAEPKEKDNGQHEERIGERSALGKDLVNRDQEERRAGSKQ